jgi:Protein of unknown function (DUF2867)
VNAVVVTDHRAEELFPFERVPLAEAIRKAIGRTAVGDVPTKFDDASSPVWQSAATDPAWTGGTELTDVRRVTVATDPQRTWEAVCRIGGERGWYRGELLWQARGLLDQVAGEVGRRLVLWAEMRLPGVAWLEWTIEPVDGGSLLVQTARFRPRGLFGRAYWYAVAPFHRLVFPGLLDGIARDALAHPA